MTKHQKLQARVAKHSKLSPGANTQFRRQPTLKEQMSNDGPIDTDAEFRYRNMNNSSIDTEGEFKYRNLNNSSIDTVGERKARGRDNAPEPEEPSSTFRPK